MGLGWDRRGDTEEEIEWGAPGNGAIDIWITQAMPFKPGSQPLHWHVGEDVITNEAGVK